MKKEEIIREATGGSSSLLKWVTLCFISHEFDYQFERWTTVCPSLESYSFTTLTENQKIDYLPASHLKAIRKHLALGFNGVCFPSGPGAVPHGNIPAQLIQGGGAEGCHALRSAGQSSHCCRIRALQQPHGLQHQPPQYGQSSSSFTACSWWSAASVFLIRVQAE